MNRRSTLLSILGHGAIFALIFLWGVQWPFQPREVNIDVVDIIDNASFEALVTQANKAQSDAIEPEATPTPPAVDEILPIAELGEVSEEPVEIEIIHDVPPEPITPPAPTPPPAPAVPGIGAAAPRVAIAPVARPTELGIGQASPAPDDEITELVEGVIEQPAPDVPAPRDEIGDTVAAIAGELGGEQAIPTPVSVAPSTAPNPPARVATTENTADIETVAPGATIDEGTAAEESNQAENTAAPSPEVAPATPAAPIVTAPPAPPARDATSLAIVEQNATVSEPNVDDLVAQIAQEVAVTPEEPTPVTPTVSAPPTPPARNAGSFNVVQSNAVSSETSVDDLVAQVAEEVEQAAEPEPAPEPAPVAPAAASRVAPSSATAPPARPSSLNVTSNTNGAANDILAELEGAGNNEGRLLSRIEKGGIIQQITKNWSIAPIADKGNLAELVVVIAFSVDASGALTTPITLVDPSSPNQDQLTAFQTAERAVLSSVPLQLPSDVNPKGVDWTLVFDPSAQSVGLV